uniref:Uncharacterized protein n=1 Tax=Anguilla anguilla TaxID=7936 RepID=A0A0E9RQ07_ANGAN
MYYMNKFKRNVKGFLYLSQSSFPP